MNPGELAACFVTGFCNGDVGRIESLLSEDFEFRGPLFRFSSKSGYIASLKGNLEPDPTSEIISIISSKEEASAFFTYKGNLIAQLFRCTHGKIDEVLVVFDAREIA